MAKLRTIAANKEWLTLKEAAKELSRSINEEVSEDDLWRLADTNMLIISILNKSQALEYARSCKTYDVFGNSEVGKMLYKFLSYTKNAYGILSTTPSIQLDESTPTLGRCFNGEWLGISDARDLTINSSLLDLMVMDRTPFYSFLQTLIDPLFQNIDERLLHTKHTPFLPEEALPNDDEPFSNPYPVHSFDIDEINDVDNFFFFTENNEIFAVDGVDEHYKIEVKINGLLVLRDVGWDVYERKLLPFVIRPHNLQICLDTLLLAPKANTPPLINKEEQLNHQEWDYIYPARGNDVNLVVYKAIAELHKKGANEPKNIKELLLTINSQLPQGYWQSTGDTIEFIDWKETNRKSVTANSLNRTIKSLITTTLSNIKQH